MATANELRKNIKASEYKDYILGFMFYKYLSDKELDYFKDWGGESEEDLVDLDIEVIDKARDANGYFIAYDDLFSVWRNIVLQKDNSTKKYVEVQKGIKGKVFPICMIQEVYFRSELDELERLNSERITLEGEIEDLWNELEEDTKSNLSKEDNSDDHSKMDPKKLNGEVKQILSELSSTETDILEEYLTLKNKQKKIDFISSHSEIEWDQMKCNKDMTYGAAVRTYIDFLLRILCFLKCPFLYQI